MELLTITSTIFVTAASLAVGTGIGYLVVRAATALLERLFMTASRGANVVAFAARPARGVKALGRAA
jgi:hypothetical protein